MKPIERMIDAAVKCLKCGKQGPPGSCACWERCSCGYFTEPGKPCGNPATTQCSSKTRYRALFKPGMRVKLTAEAQKEFAPQHKSFTTGVVRSLSRIAFYVRVRRDGCANAENWHLSFWEPAEVEPTR